MSEPRVAGWDLGGAHLKLALVGAGGQVLDVVQIPCPLWQGIERLGEALSQAKPRTRGVGRHLVTMTAELADLFPDRAAGVAGLIEAMASAFPSDDLQIYAGRAGFLSPMAACGRPVDVASANWFASADFAAGKLGQGLLIDVGSTTSDVVCFHDGRVDALGYSDEERLASEELVYSGVTRTPVMAIADRVPFAGLRQPVMAEVFATLADVYRITGQLADDADQMPAADGREKTLEASIQRLARMLGRDAASAGTRDWRRLAFHLAERQRQGLQSAAERVLSRGLIAEDAPLVGAGVGRFLVRDLAPRLSRPYVDFADLVSGAPEVREWAARCAPAVAVALLALAAT